MRICPKTTQYYKDRLIVIYYCPCHGNRKQRLRLHRGFPSNAREVQAHYAQNNGLIHAVKFLMDEYPRTDKHRLSKALKAFNQMRFGTEEPTKQHKQWHTYNRSTSNAG